MNKLLYISLLFLLSCSLERNDFRNGIDILFDSDLSDFKDKKISLVMNHTSVNKNGESLFDFLKSNLDVVSIFTPEHGLFGKNEAGELVASTALKEVPVHSLYGSRKGPSDEQLNGVDILIFDMQDIGSRYYTYISTLTYVMQAAAKNQIKLVILDRANPIGKDIQGPILKEGFTSFVGMHPVPTRHGLTIGEFSLIIKELGWIENADQLDLEIIRLDGWSGGYINFKKPPSPNIPDLETAIVYNGMCLLEGTNVSEGRGTSTPFKVIGAPWLDSKEVIRLINLHNLSGVTLSSTLFTPKSIPGKSVYPKYMDTPCNGISISIVDRDSFYPLKLGVALLQSIYQVHPDEFKVAKNGFLNKLYGSDELINSIFSGASIEDLVLTWEKESAEFRKMIKPFRLYP